MVMERKLKTDEIPHHAHRLYIKLYCENKGDKSKKTCQEARNSWSSLSINKKKHFYKTSADRNLLKNAHSLSKIETFLKEKYPTKQGLRLNKLLCNSDHGKGLEPNPIAVSINESGYKTQVESELKTDDKNENHLNSCDTNYNEHCTDELDNQDSTASAISDDERCIDQLDDNQEAEKGSLCEPTPLIDINETRTNNDLEAHNSNSTYSNQERMEVIPLDEPTPPSIRGGKDLYQVIKEPGDKRCWKDLDSLEKTHYGKAARTLKIQYIKKYTIYLKSLSQQQLFDHYVKTLYH